MLDSFAVRTKVSTESGQLHIARANVKAFMFSLAVILSISFFSTALGETTVQTVNVTVVSRCGASVVLKEATLSTEDGRSVVEMPLARVGPFFYIGHAAVAPGRYGVGASSLGKCWGGTDITVLRGHDRNVGIEATPLGSGHFDAHAFLYGTLPFAGFVRGVLIGKTFEDPVEVDGEAYYVEHAYPGDYVLKLSYGSGLECRITVVVPRQGQGERLDVTAQRAQQCLGFPYRIPNTGESGFITLFPAPSASPR